MGHTKVCMKLELSTSRAWGLEIYFNNIDWGKRCTRALKTPGVFPNRFFKTGESRSAKRFQDRSFSRIIQFAQISRLISDVHRKGLVRVDFPKDRQDIVPIVRVREG